MANTLTNLIPTIHVALDTVAREIVGLVASVARNSNAERAALNETITVPVTGAMSAADISPAATGPDPSDQTVGNLSMSISKSRSVTFYWEGEEQRGLKNAGYYQEILEDQFAQAMRALVNEVEADLAAAYASGSRAYGTAGTTPFGSDLSDAANVKKILDDNGAPPTNRGLVVDTTAGVALRSLAQLTNVNQSGDESMLRQGVLTDLFGLALRESAEIDSHTKGTGAGYLVNNAAGYAVGDTTIAADTGAGTILAGDVVTFAGDSNKYLVTSALSGGSFTIAEPGLLVALADNTAITVGDSYTANLAFHRNAIHLITRAPAMPEGGDAADDVIELQDDRSGLGFQVAMYRQRRRVAYEVGLAWGTKVVKPEFLAVLLG